MIPPLPNPDIAGPSPGLADCAARPESATATDRSQAARQVRALIRLIGNSVAGAASGNASEGAFCGSLSWQASARSGACGEFDGCLPVSRDSKGSVQTGPQVVDADGQDKNAYQAADQRVGQPGLEARSGVATGQATEAERDAYGPDGGYAGLMD